jgi:hypothetical protein
MKLAELFHMAAPQDVAEGLDETMAMVYVGDVYAVVARDQAGKAPVAVGEGAEAPADARGPVWPFIR